MTVIRRKTKRHLMVFSGRAHPALADAVAADPVSYTHLTLPTSDLV